MYSDFFSFVGYKIIEKWKKEKEKKEPAQKLAEKVFNSLKENSQFHSYCKQNGVVIELEEEKKKNNLPGKKKKKEKRKKKKKRKKKRKKKTSTLSPP